jgi:hypothetical protein
MMGGGRRHNHSIRMHRFGRETKNVLRFNGPTNAQGSQPPPQLTKNPQHYPIGASCYFYSALISFFLFCFVSFTAVQIWEDSGTMGVCRGCSVRDHLLPRTCEILAALGSPTSTHMDRRTPPPTHRGRKKSSVFQTLSPNRYWRRKSLKNVSKLPTSHFITCYCELCTKGCCTG